MSFIDTLRDKIFGFNRQDLYETDLKDLPRCSKEERETPVESIIAGPPGFNATDKFPERVLFVCSGNICRSAYAAAKFKQLTKDHDVKITSAGTLRIAGSKAAPEMVATARENGIDLDDHRSSPLSRLLIQSADLIFVMEDNHKQVITRISPESEPKIVMLGHFLNEPQQEIEDPMGQEPEVYRTVSAQIYEALENWLARLPQAG